MRRANSPPKFRWSIIACRKHRFHPINLAFLKSTSQQVNGSTSCLGENFEDSKFRVFEDSRIQFFRWEWRGVKKSRKEAGWGASFLLGDLFEVIFFFFSLKWFPLF